MCVQFSPYPGRVDGINKKWLPNIKACDWREAFNGFVCFGLVINCCTMCDFSSYAYQTFVIILYCTKDILYLFSICMTLYVLIISYVRIHVSISNNIVSWAHCSWAH